MTKTTQWHELAKRLPYQFHNKDLLRQALTHRSFGPDHNERLEFLGDALLETIISVALYKLRPHAPEGDLTRIRASIVNRNQLAALAKQLQVGDALLLGLGERKSGGKRRDSTLADAIEAIIAAVYLDSDFTQCTTFTLNIFAEILAQLPDAQDLKDAKTRLQEYLQGRGLPLPEYVVSAERGPEHARQFDITVSSQHFTITASGASRKKAEQRAAAMLLARYQGKS